MSKDALLFLDFDGVLHPDFARGKNLFSANPLLWQLLDECPSLVVVFSTSWRSDHHVEKLIQLVTRDGGEHHATRFIGTIPSIPLEAGRNIAGPIHLREIAIRIWLAGNGLQGGNWIALDDDRSGFQADCPNLFLVDKMTGLTTDRMEALIERCRK